MWTKGNTFGTLRLEAYSLVVAEFTELTKLEVLAETSLFDGQVLALSWLSRTALYNAISASRRDNSVFLFLF